MHHLLWVRYNSCPIQWGIHCLLHESSLAMKLNGMGCSLPVSIQWYQTTSRPGCREHQTQIRVAVKAKVGDSKSIVAKEGCKLRLRCGCKE